MRENRNHLQSISRSGGLARIKTYGNPGTASGRRLGGLHSVLTNKKNKTRFKQLKPIQKNIKNNAKLAELLGILMGDGHLGEYQVSVVTNSETDMRHALFVKELLEKTFDFHVSLKKRPKVKAVVILLSSKSASLFLAKKGMPVGNKIHHKMRVPDWIKDSTNYSKAFIRGLFDTDGCVFLDHHKNLKLKKIYSYIGWTITSNAVTFIADVEEMISVLGFKVTRCPTQNAIFMRRQEEVHKYFLTIGTNNPKHRQRYDSFI
jgi:intein/homing endonuclease